MFDIRGWRVKCIRTKERVYKSLTCPIPIGSGPPSGPGPVGTATIGPGGPGWPGGPGTPGSPLSPLVPAAP